MITTFKFGNESIKLTPFKIYRAHYSNMLQTYIEIINSDKITNFKEFEVVYDKASRMANIDAIKLLCNKEAIKSFKQYMEDLSEMDALYEVEDLIIDIEEQQSNKFEITVINKKHDQIIDNYTIYAPNYKTAMDRAQTFLRHKTPKEL